MIEMQTSFFNYENADEISNESKHFKEEIDLNFTHFKNDNLLCFKNVFEKQIFKK
jgi:hypothetical protein